MTDVIACERCGAIENVERSDELGVTPCGRCFAVRADANEAEAREARSAELRRIGIAVEQARAEKNGAGSIHSSSKGSPVAEQNGSLPFRPITDALRDTPTEPDWIHRGYVAPGALTLLAAPPKAGKSTKVSAQVGAIERGEPFLDLATRQTGVLLLSEERQDTLAEKARRFSLGERVELLMRHETKSLTWSQIIEAAAAHCHARDLGVLVIDTWDKWAGLSGEQENSSGAVVEALYPLARAAGEGLAVIIVTHQRKGGGRHGEAVRGSNALTGGVDVVVEMERLGEDAGPNARVLRAESRFAGTPSELTIRLNGDQYEACGEVAELKAEIEADALREAAQALGAPATVEQLVTGASESLGRELSAATGRRRLEALPDVERAGRGVKGDPYLYSISFHHERTPRGGTNSGTASGPDQSPPAALDAPLATPDDEQAAARLTAVSDDDEARGIAVAQALVDVGEAEWVEAG